MNEKLKDIKKECSKVKDIIDKRLEEFRKERDEDETFNELSFCLLTANFDAKKTIRIQDEIGNGFLELPLQKLSERLRELKHRFPNTRAKYIVDAREKKHELFEEVIKARREKNEKSELRLREWLVKNIKGIGMKEASHFMRNIGFENVSIVDFHIVDLLVKLGLIERPKTITKTIYLKIEEVLKQIAKEFSLNLAALDLCLWYYETGKILK